MSIVFLVCGRDCDQREGAVLANIFSAEERGDTGGGGAQCVLVLE